MKIKDVPCYTCIVRSTCEGIDCDMINWWNVSKGKGLSENFIREFQDKVNWTWISISQKLTECFIREFHSHINGERMVDQNLTKKIRQEFSHKLTIRRR